MSDSTSNTAAFSAAVNSFDERLADALSNHPLARQVAVNDTVDSPNFVSFIHFSALSNVMSAAAKGSIALGTWWRPIGDRTVLGLVLVATDLLTPSGDNVTMPILHVPDWTGEFTQLDALNTVRADPAWVTSVLASLTRYAVQANDFLLLVSLGQHGAAVHFADGPDSPAQAFGYLWTGQVSKPLHPEDHDQVRALLKNADDLSTEPDAPDSNVTH